MVQKQAGKARQSVAASERYGQTFVTFVVLIGLRCGYYRTGRELWKMGDIIASVSFYRAGLCMEIH